MASLLIATPCYGKVIGVGYFHSYIKTLDLLRSLGHKIESHTIGNESLITRARNNQVAYFLDSDFDYMMFIDADISWPARAVMDLLNSGYDVCGIPYPMKGRDWEKVSRFIKDKVSQGAEIKAAEIMNSSLKYTFNRSILNKTSAEHWMEVDALSTGFLMMKRKVLQKMVDHFRNELNYQNDITGYKKISGENCVGIFETMIDPDNRRYLSEDYAFCKRWRSIGGSIYMLTKYKLTHSGTADF